MPFASHQQDTLGGKLCGIDIFPVKIGTHYIHPVFHTFYKFAQILIVNAHTRNSTHCSLNNLWRKNIRRIRGA